jgi:hypothetical protein
MKDLVRLDKSGLLRDEILQLDPPSAGGPLSPPAVTPSSEPITTDAPPRKPTTATATQRVDGDAALLSNLEAAMKDSARPPGKGMTGATKAVPAPGSVGDIGRRVTSAVTKMLTKEPSPDAETLDARQGAAPALKAIAAIAGAIIIVIALMVFRPWAGPSGPVVSVDNPFGETEEVLEGINALRPLLNGAEPAIRCHALRTLAREYPGRTCEQIVTGALRDESPEVRLEAARVLRSLGTPHAARHIAALLSDADPKVRAEGARILSEMTGYTRLLRIDWRKASKVRRGGIAEEFTQWLSSNRP